MDTPITENPTETPAPAQTPPQSEAEAQLASIPSEGPTPRPVPESAIKAPQPETERLDDLIETVAPSAAHRDQRIIGPDDSSFNGFDRTYTQKPLSFFAKTEFIRVIGKAVDRALSSGDGISFSSLVGSNMLNGGTSTDVFIQAIAKLAEDAPDLLKEIYMISLGVPRHERVIVGEIFEMPHDDETGAGGLSDDDGFAIMETFVAQNAKTLTDFFAVRLRKIATQVQEAVASNSDQTQAQ